MAGLPRLDHSARNGFRTIRNGQVIIYRNDPPESATGRAGADRMIETEHRRDWFAIFDIAIGAMERVREPVQQDRFRVHAINLQPSFAEMIGLLAGLGEPGAVLD